ncbi:MAG: bifunctional DNA primase/polymerase [Phycisphaerales bacterium]|nr:bifunctional DNA primase/polymerase [Phycisphaerales bacterium]
MASALEYAGLGWRVIPCHHPMREDGVCRCSCRKAEQCSAAGKHPRLAGWPASATIDEVTIRRWWSQWPKAGVGIVTGAASGLVVIDVDPRHDGDSSLDALQREHGRLPETVESLTGGGGRHLLYQHPGGFVRSVNGVRPGIDAKADGGFIVAPPSLHESGRLYGWELSSMPRELALAELPEPWLAQVLRWTGQGTETTEGRPSALSDFSVPSVPLPPWVSPELRDRLDATLPTTAGTRNARTMNLARLLKLHPDAAGRPTSEYRDVVRWWYAQSKARTTIDATFDDQWDNFLRAFEVARVPIGVDLFASALTQTRAGPFPARAVEAYDDPSRHRLAAACQWLQAWAGDGDFSLSVAQVERAFGLRKRVAWEWLKALERDGLLVRTKRGKPGPPGSPASRWRWIGG